MELSIYADPNPFVNQVSLQIQSSLSLIVIISLIDDKGTLAKMMSCTLDKGENKIAFDKLSKLTPGAYQIEIRLLNGDHIKSIPLVKQ